MLVLRLPLLMLVLRLLRLPLPALPLPRLPPLMLPPFMLPRLPPPLVPPDGRETGARPVSREGLKPPPPPPRMPPPPPPRAPPPPLPPRCADATAGESAMSAAIIKQRYFIYFTTLSMRPLRLTYVPRSVENESRMLCGGTFVVERAIC